MDPARFGISRVEASGRQGRQEALLGAQAIERALLGHRVHPAVHPLGQPDPAQCVELGDAGGRAEDGQLFEERRLESPEGALDLAFAFGVAGLAGLDLGAQGGGELERRRVQENRRPWEVPSAPMRSVRATWVTPPRASKARTSPSKVCWRSTEW